MYDPGMKAEPEKKKPIRDIIEPSSKILIWTVN